MADGTNTGFHFDNTMLTTIITRTDDVLSHLESVNSSVMAHTDALTDANRSDSGTILSSHLAAWSSDFTRCKASLRDLNDKAQALRSSNVNTDTAATQTAR